MLIPHVHTHTQSYCPKHTALRRSPSRNHLLSSPHKNDMLHRPTQLIQVQESFYKYASVDDLVKEMKLTPKLSTLIYNYWKLKRKVCLIIQREEVEGYSWHYKNLGNFWDGNSVSCLLSRFQGIVVSVHYFFVFPCSCSPSITSLYCLTCPSRRHWRASEQNWLQLVELG